MSDILKEIAALKNKKNCIFGNIQTKRLNEMLDICISPLNKIWNKEAMKQIFFKICLE